MATVSSIKGVIKVQGVPESACFSNFSELLNALGQYLVVEIPNQTFSNVIVSTQQPGAADTDKIWFRRSNTGQFVGIYGFSAGSWIQLFPAPNEVFWLHPSADDPDSDTPPPGYKLLELSDGYFTPADYAAVIAQAVPAGGVPPYTYYPAIFVGV